MAGEGGGKQWIKLQSYKVESLKVVKFTVRGFVTYLKNWIPAIETDRKKSEGLYDL